MAPPVRQKRAFYNGDGRKGDLGFVLPDGLVYMHEHTLYDDIIIKEPSEEETINEWDLGYKGKVFDKHTRLAKQAKYKYDLKGYKRVTTPEQEDNTLRLRVKGERGGDMVFQSNEIHQFNYSNIPAKKP